MRFLLRVTSGTPPRMYQVVNTKKTTIVTKMKKAPVSKRKKERRDLESMPDYYEKEKGK